MKVYGVFETLATDEGYQCEFLIRCFSDREVANEYLRMKGAAISNHPDPVPGGDGVSFCLPGKRGWRTVRSIDVWTSVEDGGNKS